MCVNFQLNIFQSLSRELSATQFSLESARDLSGHVSRRIPATTVIMNNNNGDGSEGDEDEMFYEKIIVIKVCDALREYLI